MKKNLIKKAFGLIACVAMVISSLSFPITAQAEDLPPAPPSPAAFKTSGLEANVLFESTASYGSGSSQFNNLSELTTFYKRYDGSGKLNSSLTVNGSTLSLDIKQELESSFVYLFIQGNNDGEDWCYQEKVSPDIPFDCANTLSTISANLSSELDLSKCKIWLEAKNQNIASLDNNKVFAVFAVSSNPNPGSDAGSSAPTSTQEEDPYAYLKPLDNMIDDALAELKATGKAPTIYYAPEDENVNSLPNYIMQMLVKNPELSLEFSYKWKNVNYTIYIGPGQAIDDDEAWYGPENLYGVYMNAINPAAQIFSVSTASMQNTASNVAVSNSFNTLYVQASDAPRTAIQELLAQTLVDPDVNILITQNISPSKELTVVENGAKQVLSWSNLPKNPAGPAYALVYNQSDGTYVLGGSLNENGTATFSGFKLRPASTVTICK